MAKRATPSTSKASVKTTAKIAQAPVATQPMTQPSQAQAVAQTVDLTHEMIAQKAYEIWKSQGGSELENWLRAERELRTDTSWAVGK